MPPRSAVAGRPRFDIADIVRRHRHELEVGGNLTPEQRRVLSAIELCRTAALGGHIELCRPCGYKHHHYHSCRNRHCPKCQGLAQEKWIAARSERLLPVRHFHVVFTLPSELRALCKYRPRELLAALFQAASATLLELGRTHLDAQLGITMVLHTWTRQLLYHPHVHAIVTAGGLSRDATHWVSRDDFLFHIDVMGQLLRGKMMARLRALHRAGTLDGFNDFDDPEGFDRLMAKLARIKWRVYAKKPFQRIGHVLAYLGRYTHRVAISNSRLLDLSDQAVTFRTKNDKHVTITPVEFLRRFVQHILPDGFHKIRHYGLYASCNTQPGGRLDNARWLLPKAPPAKLPTPDLGYIELLRDLTGRDVSRCPRCGGPLEITPLPETTAAPSRSPPLHTAA